ncbi:MAG: DUF3341 domain-containing protein [Bdellovibrionaceae bacterium]|nr:DUF3341 domain-containing protein [Pseudobdellovibrionaceae bacterium]
MQKGDKAVFAIYDNKSSLETGVDRLKLNGFRLSDISILMPQESGFQEFKHIKGTKAPEGAATGASAGGVLGGVLGLLAGIGLLAIPGVGPFVGAGPIMAALAGIGVGSAVGVVSGALVGLGIPEYEAKRYEGFVKEGGILMSVHVDDSEWADKAKKIIEDTGAKDIAMTTELKGDFENLEQSRSYTKQSINPTPLI